MTLSRLSVKTKLRAMYESSKTEFVHMLSYKIDTIMSVITIFLLIIWIVLAGISFADKGSQYEQTFPSVVLYGTIVFLIVESIMWGVGRFVRRQQMFGTMEQIYMTPTDIRVIMIFSTFGRSVFLGFVIIAVTIIFGLLFPVSIGDVFLAIIVFIGAVLSSLGLALLFGAATMGIKRANVINNLVSFVLMFLMGAFFPFSFLPKQVIIIAALLPVAYATDTLRAVMIPGWKPELVSVWPIHSFWGLSPLITEIIFMYLYSLIVVFLGTWTVKKAEIQLLSKSGLGEY